MRCGRSVRDCKRCVNKGTQTNINADQARWGAYSWTGKTLVLHGSGGKYGEGREHAGYVWVSTDDGTTWKDETGDLITMAVLSGQWFDGKFYLNTAGQGIVAKVFE